MILFLGILMPPILRKCGHPKGHELTVIGLPAKKKAKSGKVQPFIKLHTSLKERGIHMSIYLLIIKALFTRCFCILCSHVSMVC